jgi:hypothetical protein
MQTAIKTKKTYSRPPPTLFSSHPIRCSFLDFFGKLLSRVKVSPPPSLSLSLSRANNVCQEMIHFIFIYIVMMQLGYAIVMMQLGYAIVQTVVVIGKYLFVLHFWAAFQIVGFIEAAIVTYNNYNNKTYTA